MPSPPAALSSLPYQPRFSFRNAAHAAGSISSAQSRKPSGASLMPRMLASRMDSMARQFLISLKPRLGEVGSPKLRPLEVGAQKPRP
uniref:Uncharacterized protein n=1 Tax=Candidatus Kentrum eta TaxID=2126337 RepID=A0A450V2T6_9GAMM|nr:MAG: hypothetical protein BECKH772A_GA0070896_101482 [Candidatus Kentron sp. H]VFJ99112.1 MAG: hypothetical protein BECKH772B_GA0070898_101502 [Candidatus Kentron sp. H]VFK03736.1 MAG: hypothetical protein BECKH772C_GA0070978_101432 [Candidatus Kentron sp. H]